MASASGIIWSLGGIMALSTSYWPADCSHQVVDLSVGDALRGAAAEAPHTTALVEGVAMARHFRVIPVLVGQARMPGAEELPGSLAKLPRLQALKLGPSYLESDTAPLLRTLDGVLADAQIRREHVTGEDTTARPENTCRNMPSQRHGSNRRPATRSSNGLTSRRHLAWKLRHSGKPGSRQLSNTGGG
jgi:hypothetical protein